jgi:hypothetical protein
MNVPLRQRLVDATQDIHLREVLTFLYRDHPQGASVDELKELLVLPEAFEEAALTRLTEEQILVFDGKRYKLAGEVRQVLDRDPTILMDEFLR